MFEIKLFSIICLPKRFPLYFGLTNNSTCSNVLFSIKYAPEYSSEI